LTRFYHFLIKKTAKCLVIKRKCVTLQAKSRKYEQNDKNSKLLVVAQLKIRTIVRR